WLLKRKNAAQEAAFWQLAKRFGLDPWVAEVQVVAVDGEPRAAVKLLPWSWKSLAAAEKDDPGGVRRKLEPFLAAGVLHRLAVLDYAAGNSDRNNSNVLESPDEKQFRLIDEGNAFDPAFDKLDRHVYVPAYLRAW